jgi:hypothetical protein
MADTQPDIERLAVATDLFRACANSLDPGTDDFELRRTFYVVVYQEVHGPEAIEQEDESFDALLRNVRELLERERCSVVFELGPDYGSRLQLIFASSDDYMLGGDFRDRLEHIRAGLTPVMRSVRRGVVAAVIVANGAITAAGGPEKAAAALEVPAPVVELIYQVNNAGTTAAAVRGVLFKKKQEEKEEADTSGEQKPRPKLNLGGGFTFDL